jgi:hypothetical protein
MRQQHWEKTYNRPKKGGKDGKDFAYRSGLSRRHSCRCESKKNQGKRIRAIPEDGWCVDFEETGTSKRGKRNRNSSTTAETCNGTEEDENQESQADKKEGTKKEIDKSRKKEADLKEDITEVMNHLEVEGGMVLFYSCRLW